MKPYVVLVVEDDAAIRRGLVDALGFAGYDVLDCDDGDQALDLVAAAAVDLILLDVMLPGRDGFAVLEAVRRTSPDLPVIMVTARGAEEDRVRGLTRGADDYVVKPFSASEVLARVQAVLRRSPDRRPAAGRFRLGDLAVDLDRREAVRDGGEAVVLTEREAAVLRYLVACRDRVVGRRELLQRVWLMDPSGVETRTVDMHVARLREKIEADPARPGLILTVRGRGYRLGGPEPLEEP